MPSESMLANDKICWIVIFPSIYSLSSFSSLSRICSFIPMSMLPSVICYVFISFQLLKFLSIIFVYVTEIFTNFCRIHYPSFPFPHRSMPDPSIVYAYHWSFRNDWAILIFRHCASCAIRDPATATHWNKNCGQCKKEKNKSAEYIRHAMPISILNSTTNRIHTHTNIRTQTERCQKMIFLFFSSLLKNEQWSKTQKAFSFPCSLLFKISVSSFVVDAVVLMTNIYICVSIHHPSIWTISYKFLVDNPSIVPCVTCVHCLCLSWSFSEKKMCGKRYWRAPGPQAFIVMHSIKMPLKINGITFKSVSWTCVVCGVWRHWQLNDDDDDDGIYRCLTYHTTSDFRYPTFILFDFILFLYSMRVSMSKRMNDGVYGILPSGTQSRFIVIHCLRCDTSNCFLYILFSNPKLLIMFSLSFDLMEEEIRT